MRLIEFSDFISYCSVDLFTESIVLVHHSYLRPTGFLRQSSGLRNRIRGSSGFTFIYNAIPSESSVSNSIKLYAKDCSIMLLIINVHYRSINVRSYCDVKDFSLDIIGMNLTVTILEDNVH